MVTTDKIYISHIIEAINRVEKYIQDTDYEKFSEEHLLQDGVIRQLEIIGEAVKNLSLDFKNSIDIPWKAMAGMRDIVIHEYFEVDLQAVWDTVIQDIPVLKEKLKIFRIE